MDIMEIVLLIAGGIIFILSFLVPEKREAGNGELDGLARDEIKALVSEELEAVKAHVEDVVDEAITYSMEKTERSLERLSNEKIMAVSSYSDTVLAEIHKSHEEVMFLYDMLNDKHANLKNTVKEVNRTVKEVAETTREAEEVVSTFHRLSPETVAPSAALPVPPGEPVPDIVPLKAVTPFVEQPKVTASTSGVISFTQETDEQGRNYNDRILELYKQGKSKVAIAKELNLGVGEVKLVIDLYKNL